MLDKNKIWLKLLLAELQRRAWRLLDISTVKLARMVCTGARTEAASTVKPWRHGVIRLRRFSQCWDRQPVGGADLKTERGKWKRVGEIEICFAFYPT